MIIKYDDYKNDYKMHDLEHLSLYICYYHILIINRRFESLYVNVFDNHCVVFNFLFL